MFGLLLWNRPYERRSGNVINIFIMAVRVISVVCILVFVEQLGISQTTKTVTGVVLIAVQSALTGALAILIAVNAIISCCKQNPHRKRRKEAGKNNLPVGCAVRELVANHTNREIISGPRRPHPSRYARLPPHALGAAANGPACACA